MATDDKDDDESPSTPAAKRKISVTVQVNNKHNGAGNGGKANGPRTPTPRRTSAQKNATPIRKPSANAAIKTPNSAPARQRSAGVKKPEPTLLGDFLLGRPSPGRKSVKTRRKSLDVVKAEMRVNNVQQMQQPGKVQERVKQWQKKNAKSGEMEVEKGLDEIVVEYETESDIEVETPEPRLRGGEVRAKSRTPEARNRDGDVAPRGTDPRPGRRKDREEKEKEDKPRSKSVAPKKRVISDEHWMKNRRRSPPGKGTAIPKNFLQATAINPPVERKIEDWVKRMASPEPPARVETPKRKVRRAESEDEEKPRSRKVSRRVRPSRSPSPDDGMRIKPPKDRPSDGNSRNSSTRPSPMDDGIRIKPSPNDDGIRIKPSPNDDGIRVRPSDDTSVHSEIQIKRIRNDGSKRRPKDENETPTPTPRKKSEHLAPPTESESRSRKTSYTTTIHDDDATSYMSPTQSKRRNHKSDVAESLDDIPFGNSAFSVLDLPVGAEANNTVKRPEPKRNNSFAAVPKVLKRVYTEGMKRVHDAEPTRGGPNQPPSIETWLNGTTDPFIDRPATADASLPVADSPVSRMRSFKEDDRTERELTAEQDHKQKRRASRAEKEPHSLCTPHKRCDDRGALPSMGASPPISPLGLKRTGATRATSSPKTTKKFGLKDAIFDAFKGESVMAKTAVPSPFDFIGLREGHVDPTETESSIVSSHDDVPVYQAPPKTSPRAPEKHRFEDVSSKQAKPVSYTRRPPPVAGGPSLSTIASVTSYSNSSTSSATETGSELSHTTVTQATLLSGTTGSNLSRGSKKSSSQKEGQIEQTSLKRRLTKHADLVSMLSLPDTTQPGRAGSIRSARSIRTKRTRLEDATIEDLLREVSEDESKYMRELNTLVDGVIPVLLTCVLSKSDSAVAAGLFEAPAFPSTDPATSFTKPIVDMGVALERLKSLHKRIPLTDPDSFLHWTEQAIKVYDDYLLAWRTGFEDIVVSLVPASRSAVFPEEKSSETLPVNQNGDLVRDSGEVVDVAHLLKSPMRRLRNLSRVAQGFVLKRPTKKAHEVLEAVLRTEEHRRVRVKEEAARKEDMKANRTDTTLARDPKTLEPAEGVTINRSRQVSMKDTFKFDMCHSNGQRLECEVELTFREVSRKNRSPINDPGDVLISQIVDGKSSLLFPPVLGSNISARKGDSDKELVVMIRGQDGKGEWSELFVLEGDETEVRDEWLDILPPAPFPGLIIRKTMELDPDVSSMISAPGADLRSVVGSLKKIPNEAPIGERRRREYEQTAAIKNRQSTIVEELSSPELPPYRKKIRPMRTAMKALGDLLPSLGEGCVYELKDLNDAMARAGYKDLVTIEPDMIPIEEELPKKTRFASIDQKMDLVMSGCLSIYDQRKRSEEQAEIGSLNIPKLRSPSVEKSSTPLKESMRPNLETISKSRPTTPRDDGAPPPPVHLRPVTPPTLKNIPVIDSATPKVKNRRGSSPLKHEYQPSVASVTSSNEDYSSSDDDSYTSSEDSLDELELAEHDDMPCSLPGQSTIYGRKVSPPLAIYNIPNDSVAPSNSASQAAPRNPAAETKTFMAVVTYWNKNNWDPIHPDPCTVVVGPGWIDTYEQDNPYSSRAHQDADASTTSLITPEAAVKNPLVAQDLTPNVHVRQSNAVDVQIRSPMATRSRVQNVGYLQYRLLNTQHCKGFYDAVHSSRFKNPIYHHLSEERDYSSFGQGVKSTTQRRSWLFRKKSFRRKNIELDSNVPPSYGDSNTSSRLFRGGLRFNIGKSSVSRVAPSSANTSSSGFSNVSPPDTPGGSQGGSMFSSGTAMHDIGTRNLPIMLYSRVRHSWASHGQAFLTISEPGPHQRQSSSLYGGPKKHILVTLKPSGKATEGRVILDEVLGADAFSRGGNTGIYATIWRDIVDEKGNVGVVPRFGGVSGKTDKWCFQSARQGDCAWIYTMLKSVVVVAGM